MHVVILSQYYPPETGAPQVRLSSLASQLVKRGHRVTVLTAMPNYPGGRIYAGYGGWLRREKREGVKVIRTFVLPTQRAALLPRLTSYLSFAASAAVVGVFSLGKADFLLVESPPLFLGPVGWWLSVCCRARMIFNVSDLWPESAVRLGVLSRKSFGYRVAEWIESFCYRHAWTVSGQSRSIVADITSRFPSVRTFYLSNGADTRNFGPGRRRDDIRRELASGRETVVLYAGLHGLAQGLDQLIDAAAILAADRRFQFVLVGDGPDKAALMADVARRGLDHVTFCNPRPFTEMPGLLASADVIVVSLKGDIPGAVPSKLYEAMASGVPLVLVATGEAAGIIRNADAGIVVAPGQVEALARAIVESVEDSGRSHARALRARHTAESRFDRAAIASEFIDHLESSLLPSASTGSL